MRILFLRILSLISFLSGVFLILNSDRKLLGAIIGISSAIPANSITGALLVLISLILFMVSGSLEDLISEEEFERRYEKTEPNLNRRVLILDTSLLLTYSPQELKRILKRERVFIPNSVLEEIKNPNLKKLIEAQRVAPEGYSKLEEEAKKYLKNTDKHQMFLTLMPYLEARLEGKELDLNRRDVAEIKNKIGRLMKLAREEKIDMGGDNKTILKKAKEYLERHCRLSDADIDVVAIALYEAKQGKHALVGEKDIDIRQAINIIKKDNPRLGKNIDYIEPYST